MTIPNAALSAIGNAGIDDLQDVVEAQLRDVRLAGQVYRFRPETKCRVCRNAELRERVEDMLSTGTTYQEILRILEPVNAQRGQRHRITYHSVRWHARECFTPSRAAVQVYREILERRAEQYSKNYIRGATHAVTIMAVLETVMVKGYAAITDDRIPITPELAISAGIKLHELMAKDQGANQAAEMIAKVHRLMEVVNRITTPEQRAAIEEALAAESDALDVDYTEEDDDDYDDEEFDPARDADERITDSDDGF
jgi:hypothetical protein